MSASTAKLRPPGWLRWLGVALRGLHLVAVVVLGAALLGAPVAGSRAAAAVLATGLSLFAIDFYSKPGYLREASGISLLAKQVLVSWMAIDADARPVLFWLIVVGSAVFAHAPASFRHAVLIGPPKPPKE